MNVPTGKSRVVKTACVRMTIQGVLDTDNSFKLSPFPPEGADGTVKIEKNARECNAGTNRYVYLRTCMQGSVPCFAHLLRFFVFFSVG